MYLGTESTSARVVCTWTFPHEMSVLESLVQEVGGENLLAIRPTCLMCSRSLVAQFTAIYQYLMFGPFV